MPSPLVARFLESMVMNHDRWHDGTGYDLECIAEATPEEYEEIKSLLLSRSVNDWRDVEALAALGTPEADARLRNLLENGDGSLGLALALHAADRFTEEEICGILVPALREVENEGGLVQAMLVVEDFHPAPILDALLDGARDREGAVAMEFAQMLLYLHGKISSLYEMEERPFLLGFLDGDRAAVFRELCERIDRTAKPSGEGG